MSDSDDQQSKKSSENKAAENKTNSEESGNIYDDLQSSILSEQWQKIFDTLNIDQQEYRVFLSLSSKIDDGGPSGPISPMNNPKK